MLPRNLPQWYPRTDSYAIQFVISEPGPPACDINSLDEPGTKTRAGQRPLIAVKPDEGVVFLTSIGGPFTPNHLSLLARGYVRAATISKTGACHIFRHTMATLMLEGGADIRYIQAMLGHVRLDTTQIYTHVSIRMLKQIHTATHPAARLDAGTLDLEKPKREAEEKEKSESSEGKTVDSMGENN